MQLRQLTRLSTIRLEAERDQLRSRIAGLQAIVDDPDRLKHLVSEELADTAATYGDARRTVLLEGGGSVVTAATPLEIQDGPCVVMLSSTGLLGRVDLPEGVDGVPSDGPRGNHDVLISHCRASIHGDFGLVTNRGRLIKCAALSLPTAPLTADAPHLRGGSPVGDLVALETGERALAVVALDATLALGTRQGVVKRVNPEALAKDSWDVIRLDDDEVVGACAPSDEDELTFIATDAQLLHFPAGVVRPQGRAGGGMAGIKLGPGATVAWFGAVPVADSVVVTVSGTSGALPGTQGGNVKLTGFDEYPGKGRATGGVRCHRFLKGEDTLLIAWAGPTPAVAASAAGTPIELTSPMWGRRDGSGTPALQPIAAIASRRLG